VTAAMDVANMRAAKKSKLEDENKAIVYYCYYCNSTVMSSLSLDVIRTHWRSMHKDEQKCSVFRYKQHLDVRAKCAYCAEPGTRSTLIDHIWQKHGRDKDILLVNKEDDYDWMCKWYASFSFTASPCTFFSLLQ
jgi:predicted transposase YbfD/YdcC